MIIIMLTIRRSKIEGGNNNLEAILKSGSTGEDWTSVIMNREWARLDRSFIAVAALLFWDSPVYQYQSCKSILESVLK